MTRVLVIEDDPAVRRGVSVGLRHRGHETVLVATGEDGLAELVASAPEVVLLDLMLPGMSGLETCRRIRAFSQVPIVILSARDDDVDIVVGLEAGADDYVIKPASSEVIEARMRAVLRRTAPPASSDRARTTHGDLLVDRVALRALKHGTQLALAPTELRLLLFLSAAPEQTFSRQQLLEQVWEHTFYGDYRLVDACVMRLRAKIEDDPRNPRYIQTVRGFGYRFGPL
ncbi:response regulator transcription factor [Streptosporangium sp. NPDC006930]|uniref:response regulator transcription factor n=1 Tax=unclassified Streptosporangium TaxID=2632669 RepID=UPI00341EA818